MRLFSCTNVLDSSTEFEAEVTPIVQDSHVPLPPQRYHAGRTPSVSVIHETRSSAEPSVGVHVLKSSYCECTQKLAAVGVTHNRNLSYFQDCSTGCGWHQDHRYVECGYFVRFAR